MGMKQERSTYIFRTRIIMVFVLFFISPSLFGQKKVSPRRVTRPEMVWALTHPFVAMKALKLTRIALGTAEAMRGDTILDNCWVGGQLDAFRHSYWMAMCAQKIKPRKVIGLGNAHEKGNWLDYKKGRLEEDAVPDSVNSAMDYYNNARGVQLGCENRKASPEELKRIIINDILAGNMKIVATDAKGNYIDCSGMIIDLRAWTGKWNIPKCLAPSNQTLYRNFRGR